MKHVPCQFSMRVIRTPDTAQLCISLLRPPWDHLTHRFLLSHLPPPALDTPTRILTFLPSPWWHSLADGRMSLLGTFIFFSLGVSELLFNLFEHGLVMKEIFNDSVSMSDVHGNFHFSFPVGHEQLQLEPPKMWIPRAIERVFIYCMMSTEDTESTVVHWYQKQPHQIMARLKSVISTNIPAPVHLSEKTANLRQEKVFKSLCQSLPYTS